ncbi:uncharacterized protein LOC142166134 [Nicotiana tabacum]|uniref:Uncharacterized protein LOC142166134 n=1 Tax=Nicotiana tabacum TaxID=4097 RepID=A0AC58S6N8_TOBAC
MVLAQKEIYFLRMHFVKCAYSLETHICQKLLKFPDTSLTTKKIHQFLGVLNYVRDCISYIFKYISPLTEMLKKNSPSWGKKQDEAVREIKEISNNVRSLSIPSEGKKILQTNTSNEYWSAVLFEEKDGKIKICEYASKKFKDVEQHFHSTFKNILAVKNRIKKFIFS